MPELSAYELQQLRDAGARHPQQPPPRDDREIQSLEQRVRAVEGKIEQLHGENGIAVAWPVISFEGASGKKGIETTEPVDFWRNGILVRRFMVVAGGPSTSLL